MKTISCAIMLGAGILLPTLQAPTSADQSKWTPNSSVIAMVKTFASGVSTDNSVKFFGDPRTGTWSMVMIMLDGIACVIAVGDGLEVIKLAFAQGVFPIKKDSKAPAPHRVPVTSISLANQNGLKHSFTRPL